MAGTRLASRDTMSNPPATDASVNGSEALTPYKSFSRSFPDASAATVPTATPMIAGAMPSSTTSRRTSGVPAPNAVLIPISRLRPRTMYDRTL